MFGENQWSLGELTGERVEELSSAIMKQMGVESSTHLSESVSYTHLQMFDGGGLNGLEESAAPETGASLDAEVTGEDGSEPFNPQLADADSVRRQGSMLMKRVEELSLIHI